MLVARLEAELGTERFPVGSKLPTEARLAGILQTSRYALRKALGLLIGKGRLRAVPRVGAFVAPERMPISISTETSALQELECAGLNLVHRLLASRTCRPPNSVSRKLGLARRSEVIEVEQQTLSNGAPFSHITTWLPADRFARLTRLLAANSTVKAAIQKLGIGTPRNRAMAIHSRSATRQEAKLLAIPSNAHVLVLDCISVDGAGEPTHVSRCVVDAARIELLIELQPRTG